MKKLISLLLAVLVMVAAGTVTAFADTVWGIDVSHHQGQIDWEAVKDEVDFAIIRCGYGQDMTSQDDRCWKYNADECTRLGIPFGVYLYSYALNTENAASEAEHVLRLISGYKLSLPVFYDMEDEKNQVNLTAEEKGQLAKTFCDRISAEGYSVGIYANLKWWNNYLTDPVFDNSNWTKWVAQWPTDPATGCTYTGTYSCWQYSSKGSVNGITGDVDRDIWYEDFLVQDIAIEIVKGDDGLTVYADESMAGKRIMLATYTEDGKMDSVHYFTDDEMSEMLTDSGTSISLTGDDLKVFALDDENRPQLVKSLVWIR